jgi:Aldehyde dehydrogenase family
MTSIGSSLASRRRATRPAHSLSVISVVRFVAWARSQRALSLPTADEGAVPVRGYDDGSPAPVRPEGVRRGDHRGGQDLRRDGTRVRRAARRGAGRRQLPARRSSWTPIRRCGWSRRSSSGPVIPVIPFDDDAEAVRLANDTWAGLCASVWTADTHSATRLGGQLGCGYVWVDDDGAARLDLRAPFGGMKQSAWAGSGASRASAPSRTPARSHSRRTPPNRRDLDEL